MPTSKFIALATDDLVKSTIKPDEVRNEFICSMFTIESKRTNEFMLISRVPNLPGSRTGLTAEMPQIRKGDKLPSLTLYEALPENQTNIFDLVANKKAIIFGVPGAYVPGCSRVHLRGFIEKSTDLKLLGFQEIICVAVNDPFVMSAWGNAKGANDKIRMLADPTGLYTKAIGMDTNIPELGGTRSRRYSMTTIDGIVKELFVDAPNVKLTCLQTDGVPTYCT